MHTVTTRTRASTLAGIAALALAGLAQRTMQLQATIQDGHAWLGDGQQAVELTPERLHPR